MRNIDAILDGKFKGLKPIELFNKCALSDRGMKLGNRCNEVRCSCCSQEILDWLKQEYVEPVDWSSVAVDTPILVRDTDIEKWKRMLFACHKDGVIYAWAGGQSSFTANYGTFPWKYAKLYKGEAEDGEY